MSFLSKAGVPPTPTLPTGVQIADFDTYLEAQRAVDFLSDREFAVQHTTIVGTELRMVERITGRLSYPRVALAGAMSGAWFGLFVGLLFGLLSEGSIVLVLLPALIIGAAFGILFALVSYAFTGGKRDFTSSSQVVAGKYALLCDQTLVGEASRLLAEGGIRTSHSRGPSAPGPGPGTAPGAFTPAGTQWGAQQGVPDGAGRPDPRPAGPPPRPTAAETSAAGPASGTPDADGSPDVPTRAPFSPWQDEHGNPRYGQRLPATGPEQPTDEDRP